jgi:hypothetical protein
MSTDMDPVGKRITDFRPMTTAEVESMGWEPWEARGAVVLVLDDGTLIVPMRDPEGNGAGTLDFADTNGDHFLVVPR